MEKIAIKDLDIFIKRSPKRKTVELSVERDGEIILYAPEEATMDSLKGLVQEKLVWIYQHLGRKEEESHQGPQKEFVSGEGFYYLGRKYRLKLVDNEQVSKRLRIRFLNGRFMMRRELADSGREIFVEWYRARASEWLSQRIQKLKERVNAEPKEFEVRDLSFRWASCTEDGKVYFHWRIILLPPERIEYLVLHELVHLHEHNHGPEFYERLRRAVPNYEGHEEWLRQNGDRYNL